MKIGIDMGHTVSGPNSGAVGIINESDETRVIGKKIIEYLKVSGNTVVNCTVDAATSSSESLSKRVEKANAQHLDLFVSIHFNASNGNANGTEVYTYGGKEHDYAKRVLQNIVSIGFYNRGIKDGSSLYVIRNSKSTSMLIEVCFCDNKKDTDLYKKNVDNIAKTIAEGIIGKKIGTTNTASNDNIKLAVCVTSKIKDAMINEIKALQKVVGLKEDGIATEGLINKLPDLTSSSQRGVVTIMQRILILKGFLSSGSDTGIIGNANINGINKFKESVGIPISDKVLIDKIAWRKLLEY